MIKDLVSVQMIASLGGDVKPLALSPSYFLSIGTGHKRTHTAVRKRVGDVDPGGVVYLSWGEDCHGPAVIGFTLLRCPCQELAKLIN